MFKEFYYYVYEIHTGKGSENSKFLSSLIGITYLQSINFITLSGIGNYFIQIVINKEIVVFLGILIYVSFTVINYFYLYRKRNEIIKRVDGFTNKREKIGKTFFVIYIIASLFLLFYGINNFAPVRHLVMN